MLSVPDVAGSLRARVVATVTSGAALERRLLSLRLGAAQRRTQRIKERHVEPRKLLESLLRYVRRDIALLAFADALVASDVRDLADVRRLAPRIHARANLASGFDVLVVFRGSRLSSSQSTPSLPDPRILRRTIADRVRSRLAATPLDVVLDLASTLGEPALAHDLRINFERLEALALRASASWDARLRDAADLYLEGKIELPEVARLLGLGAADIAAEFERLGYVRALATLALSETQRQALAEKLSTHRAKLPFAADRVHRDVVASQRIEGIDARLYLNAPSNLDS